MKYILKLFVYALIKHTYSLFLDQEFKPIEITGGKAVNPNLYIYFQESMLVIGKNEATNTLELSASAPSTGAQKIKLDKTLSSSSPAAEVSDPIPRETKTKTQMSKKFAVPGLDLTRLKNDVVSAFTSREPEDKYQEEVVATERKLNSRSSFFTRNKKSEVASVQEDITEPLIPQSPASLDGTSLQRASRRPEISLSPRKASEELNIIPTLATRVIENPLTLSSEEPQIISSNTSSLSLSPRTEKGGKNIHSPRQTGLLKRDAHLNLKSFAQDFFKGKQSYTEKNYKGHYTYIFLYKEVKAILELFENNYLVILDNEDYYEENYRANNYVYKHLQINALEGEIIKKPEVRAADEVAKRNQEIQNRLIPLLNLVKQTSFISISIMGDSKDSKDYSIKGSITYGFYNENLMYFDVESTISNTIANCQQLKLYMNKGYCYKLEYRGQDQETIFTRFILKYDSITFEKESTETKKSFTLTKEVYDQAKEINKIVSVTIYIEGFGSNMISFEQQVNDRLAENKKNRNKTLKYFLGNSEK
jgi:GR25 family glycosyltransferase involved in LPS biosynthesis